MKILFLQDQQKIMEQVRVETAKAYGGCTKCYGKGYATVNAQWHGYDTDTDIGSPGGYVSGGNPNAIKFCNCSRGEQLKARLEQVELEARIDAARHIDGMLPAEEPTILASNRTEDEDSAWLKAKMSFADGFSDDVWRYIRELKAQLTEKGDGGE